MSDARRTHDTDAGTDPRYHAAFQRGYDGPAPERGAKAEEQFRRPRRHDAAATRPRTTALPTSEPVLDPIRALGFEAPAERTAALPTREDDEPQEPQEPEMPSQSAFDTRVPIALVALGVLLLVLGVVVVWSGSSSLYNGASTPSERFTMYAVTFLPGPLVTVGLLSIGAALAVRVVRR